MILSPVFPNFNSNRLGSVEREVNVRFSDTIVQILSVFITILYLHFQRVNLEALLRRQKTLQRFLGEFC